MVKDGDKHLESLRNGREVYLRGEQVGDVVEHAAFRNSVRSAAALYDFQVSAQTSLSKPEIATS